MKLAFVYAGQGSQKVGMGKDFYENSSVFKKAFDEADPTGKYKKLCFEGPMEELMQTENTQPALVAFAVGVYAMLQAENITPEIAAGLSLGEYSALCGAGVWDAKTTMDITAFRGNAMKNAVEGVPTAMSAIVALDREKLQEACDNAKSYGVVEIANYNCPGQLVISGNYDAVKQAEILAKEAGARKTVPIMVSGPFHTSLMEPASVKLKEKFSDIDFGEMKYPIIFNATAKTLGENENIKSLLEKQVKTAVLFEDSVRLMAEMGVDTIIEIGPGKVLAGFIKKTAPEIKTLTIEDMAGFEAAVKYLKGE